MARCAGTEPRQFAAPRIGIDAVPQYRWHSCPQLGEQGVHRAEIGPNPSPPGAGHDQREVTSDTVLTDEDASLDYAGQRFSAVKSPFGRLPVIQPDNTRLLEMEAGRNRYLVMTGPGATLFSVGDWQRFSFLEVLNVTRKGAVQHYALVADAHLGERVLGRLPGSPVLNYARLVPSAWASSTEPDAFEVLLYALDGKAPKRVVGESGQPVAYTLSRDAATGAWVLAPTDATPVADAHDKAGLGFTVSTRLRAEATKTVPTAPSASATDAPPQSAR